MKKTLALIVAAVALLVLALPMVSAQAATPTPATPSTSNAVATLTFTQAEINKSFWVNNPADPHITDAMVDLQSAHGGQVVITAVYTWLDAHNRLTSVILRVVTVPEIVDGHVIWVVTGATANGQPVTADQRNEINLHLLVDWEHWVNNHLPNATFTKVAITDDTITFTFHPYI